MSWLLKLLCPPFPHLMAFGALALLFLCTPAAATPVLTGSSAELSAYHRYEDLGCDGTDCTPVVEPRDEVEDVDFQSFSDTAAIENIFARGSASFGDSIQMSAEVEGRGSCSSLCQETVRATSVLHYDFRLDEAHEFALTMTFVFDDLYVRFELVDDEGNFITLHEGFGGDDFSYEDAGTLAAGDYTMRLVLDGMQYLHWTDDDVIWFSGEYDVSLDLTPVPEPGTALLGLVGLAGLAVAGRRPNHR
ncbi:MAG: PEP-CTERM sorting domain-containing protein [Proteobacteria bacterium]|nr:PEP-CTERM sorting domain-containing protein [Pseudomonadota bacterium]